MSPSETTVPLPRYQPALDYFQRAESRLLYAVLLGGTKHFGYYPAGQRTTSERQAQRRMHDLLAERLRLQSGQRVLDAGCGQGRVAVDLARRYGCRAVGVTVTPFEAEDAVRWAGRHGASGRTAFLRMDYTRLGFAPASVDAAFTMESLVHAYDLRATLAELLRVLRPGGRLACFEYSMAPEERVLAAVARLPAETVARFGDPERWLVERSGMLAMRALRHGALPGILRETGFVEVDEADITAHVRPSLLRLHRLLRLPSLLVRRLGLHDVFVNTAVAAEMFPLVLEGDLFRYNVTTARKP
jgi:SAM-dependent methyltransferase